MLRLNVFRAIGAALAVLLAVASPVSAQQSVDLGSVSGRVIDPSGGVVVDAHVTARHLETNVTDTTRTDAVGRFRFPRLRVGSYEVTVQHEGFATLSQRLAVSAVYRLRAATDALDRQHRGGR